MTTNRSLLRVAALTGVAAFLFSVAHVSPAAAQTTYHKTCIASASEGASAGECTVQLPVGKRFVIESATVAGGVESSQHTRVEIRTTLWGGTWAVHHVPAGFQVLSNSRSVWSGALPGRIFAEAIGNYAPGAGSVRLYFYRGATTGWANLRMTLTGYLEDM